MQKYLDILKNSALFSGIDTKDLINMFKCLLMNIKTYEKNSYILKASEPLVEVGIILKGRVNIIKGRLLGQSSNSHYAFNRRFIWRKFCLHEY